MNAVVSNRARPSLARRTDGGQSTAIVECSVLCVQELVLILYKVTGHYLHSPFYYYLRPPFYCINIYRWLLFAPIPFRSDIDIDEMMSSAV